MFIFHAGKVVQFLEIIVESIIIIPSTQFYLETAIATNMGTQSTNKKVNFISVQSLSRL